MHACGFRCKRSICVLDGTADSSNTRCACSIQHACIFTYVLLVTDALNPTVDAPCLMRCAVSQNTTCIQETSNFSRSWQACAVAGDIPHEIPRVFSGDTMNLTVSLGTTQQRLHPSTQDAVIGIVQLQQPPDGSLFVIGDIRQQMQMGLATFSNMALQPVTPPISNREYEFRCVSPAALV